MAPLHSLPLNTQDVLTVTEQELTQQVSRMALRELEQHACNIIRRLGAEDTPEQFRVLMGSLIKVIPDTELSSSDKYQAIQSLLKTAVPGTDAQTDIHPRLAIIMTMIVVKRFHAMHGESPNEAVLH